MKPTKPFSSIQLRTPLGSLRRQTSAGFTLMELMVVVIIITLLATIAIPGIARRMQTNRAKEATEAIANIYRNARLHALGRGSAVMVRYNDGVFQILEGIRGDVSINGQAVLDAGCKTLPESSCLLPDDRWDPGSTKFLVLSTHDFQASGTFDVDFNYLTATNTPAQRTTMDVCYSPLGRTYADIASSGTLQVMNSALRVDLKRSDDVGIQRSALISPAGTARVVATP